MRSAGKIGFAILGGGMLLGALLGAYAEPEMKRPPESARQLTGQPEFEAGPAHHFVSFPEDLNPYGGYRPDLDYDAEISDWSPRYPEWTFGDLEEELAYANEPPALEHDAAEAISEEADPAPPSSESAPGDPQAGHRIARVQADGLW